MQVSCRSEQTCRTSCFSIGRMLCHGGAPIWTALTVKTGEITGISFSTGKVGPGPIRTLRVDLNPLPVLFSEKDFKSHFPLSGNFVPVGQFFSGKPLNFLQIGSRKWGVGVKWLGPRRLGKMAARSDAARQRPRGHPGLQHTSVRPPSDATPPRYCRFSALPPYSSRARPAIGSKVTKTQ